MALRILIVEDHVATVSALARLLRSTGYEVDTASSCQDARTIASKFSFDLLICDIGLPDGNGCALLRELDSSYGLNGIALTGYGMPGDVANIERAGFLLYLLKPVDYKILTAAIEKAIGKKTVQPSGSVASKTARMEFVPKT